MKHLLLFASGVALVLWAFGVALHRDCRGAPVNELGWVSVAGYDSEAYLTQFTNPAYITDVNHRHPVMKPLLLPVFAVGTSLAEKVSPEAGKTGVIGCFALFGAADVVLLWLIMTSLGAALPARIASTLLWLSFAHVWLLGGMAESFGVSATLLLLCVWLRARGVRDARAWGALAVLAAGVTVTNGVKPLLAGVRDRRTLLRTVAAVAVIALAAVAAVAAKWLWIDGIAFGEGCRRVFGDIALGFTPMTPGERAWFAWNAFWCEPIVFHWDVVSRDVIRNAYSWWGPHALAAAVLVFAALGAFLNRSNGVVRTILLFVSFDVLLHVVVGWGLAEGQIYSGHWLWAVPVLVSLLPGRCWRAVLPLALFIMACNAAMMFG